MSETGFCGFKNVGDYAIITIGDYNGFGRNSDPGSFFARLSDYIQNDTDKTLIKYPNEDTLPEMQGDCNNYPRVLWSYLVIAYGDYGTSPRFGWLMAENKDYILKMLQEGGPTSLE